MKVRLLNVVTSRFRHEATGTDFVPGVVEIDGAAVVVGVAIVDEDVAARFVGHPHFVLDGPAREDVLDLASPPASDPSSEPPHE